LTDACAGQAAIAPVSGSRCGFRRYNIRMDLRLRSNSGLTATLAIAALCAVFLVTHAGARMVPLPEEIGVDALPLEARATLERIRSGGPLPYERDGVVFGNREGLLPAKPHGFYHEYTVKTPRAHTRGARRIVCGGAITSPSECYYSNDHYRSFKRIRQ
jgi:ribonuclease T1